MHLSVNNLVLHYKLDMLNISDLLLDQVLAF